VEDVGCILARRSRLTSVEPFFPFLFFLFIAQSGLKFDKTFIKRGDLGQSLTWSEPGPPGGGF